MSEKIPVLILLVGIPGSGKSGWLKYLFERHTEIMEVPRDEYIMVCPDNIRKELSGDISNQAINIDVWRTAKERTTEALNSGKSVVLDATNVDTIYRQDFIKGLPKCRLYAKLFPVEPHVAYNRVKYDVERGIDRANVPERVIYRMYGDFLYTSKVIESEGFKII